VNNDDSSLVRLRLLEQIQITAQEWQRPSTVYRAKIFKDGSAWCCLLGPNIMEGVCAFGATPQQAVDNFDFYAWLGKEPPQRESTDDYNRREQMSKKTQQGKPVIVRTYSAGVHFGYLKAKRGREVDLTDSRRIWYWKGANTLNEIALHGLDEKNSKVSQPVSLTILEAIEIIDVTPASMKSLESVVWQNAK